METSKLPRLMLMPGTPNVIINFDLVREIRPTESGLRLMFDEQHGRDLEGNAAAKMVKLLAASGCLDVDGEETPGHVVERVMSRSY